MLIKNAVKLYVLLCFLVVSLSVQAQYVVTGGNGTPLLANDMAKDEGLAVYLVNGMNGLEIRYTSGSASHQWYRYKTRRVEAEKVPCVQNGTTSTVSDPEEGYGYFVEEPGLSERYVWIINYNRHELDISNLMVANPDDACSFLKLSGTMQAERMPYRTPLGKERELFRQFEVAYKTLEWSETNKSFSLIDHVEQIEGNPFEKLLPAPLCDSEIKLSGDLFARHFNREKFAVIDSYDAIAVNMHAYMTLDIDTAQNMSGDDNSKYSAPLDVHFSVYANEPVASLFIWKIYRDEEGPEKPFARFTGKDFDYTFNERGDFTVSIEVSDRTGKCSDQTSFSVQITDSKLEIPNAFSPGTTPGMNDEFRVVYKSIVSFKGWIFNRWGIELFHWTNPAQGWDGKKGGKYVSPGVYFYVIEAKGADGTTYHKKGPINIFRPKTIDDESAQ